MNQRRGNGVRILDDGLLGSRLRAILLAFVRDFGWTCWWTYVGCFGPVEKISIMPIQQSSITLVWDRRLSTRNASCPVMDGES